MPTIDTTSPTWAAIAAWAGERRAAYLATLAQPLIGERPADVLRGRIAELDDLVRLAQPARIVHVKPVEYGV